MLEKLNKGKLADIIVRFKVVHGPEKDAAESTDQQDEETSDEPSIPQEETHDPIQEDETKQQDTTDQVDGVESTQEETTNGEEVVKVASEETPDQEDNVKAIPSSLLETYMAAVVDILESHKDRLLLSWKLNESNMTVHGADLKLTEEIAAVECVALVQKDHVNRTKAGSAWKTLKSFWESKK